MVRYAILQRFLSQHGRRVCPGSQRAYAARNAIQMKLLDSFKHSIARTGMPSQHHIERILCDTASLIRIPRQCDKVVHCQWPAPHAVEVDLLAGGTHTPSYDTLRMRATMIRIIAAINVGSTTLNDDIPVFPPLVDELASALAAQQIELSPGQVESLDGYRRQLWSWNERMNLTRHTTIDKFVGRDVVDSQELSNLLERGERVLDVGTGGGVPGVILAILRPDLSVSLCDSTQKKARAVEAMVGELGLPIRIFPNRVEEVLEITTFDTLVARALAPLVKVLPWFHDRWDAFDQLLMIKGPSWIEERAAAREAGLMRNLELRNAASYQAPITGAESVILSIQQKN
jgi:16S rRNA (guanine527-N7)-methyltransferase